MEDSTVRSVGTRPEASDGQPAASAEENANGGAVVAVPAETIDALRSSSSLTWLLFASSSSAISTIPTAPSTIFCRAAMMAPACWRRSIADAISCA